MILFFTGTGNSRYIANALADRLGDEVVSLNEIIKNGAKKQFDSDKPYVIVAPIYAWRMARIIDEVFESGEFNGCKEIYFVATMGANTGNAYKYCKKMAMDKGLEFKGFRGVPMPNNYVIDSVMEDEETTDAIVAAAMPIVDEIAKAIESGAEIRKTDKTPVPFLLSGPVNNMFTKYMCSAKDYVVSDECISCGKCVSLCPYNNITIKEGEHPVFGDKCINCYACIQYCPKQAIDIPGKTEKHGRYTCKEYKS